MQTIPRLTRAVAALAGATAIAAGGAVSAYAATDNLTPQSFRDAGFRVEGHHGSSTRSENVSVNGQSETRMVDVVPGTTNFATSYGGSDSATLYQARTSTDADATVAHRKVDALVGQAVQEPVPGGQWGYDTPIHYDGKQGGEASIWIAHGGDGRPAGLRVTGHHRSCVFNLDVQADHSSNETEVEDLAQSALNDCTQQ